MAWRQWHCRKVSRHSPRQQRRWEDQEPQIDNPCHMTLKCEMWLQVSAIGFMLEDQRGKLQVHRKFVGVRKDVRDILRQSKTTYCYDRGILWSKITLQQIKRNLGVLILSCNLSYFSLVEQFFAQSQKCVSVQILQENPMCLLGNFLILSKTGEEMLMPNIHTFFFHQLKRKSVDIHFQVWDNFHGEEMPPLCPSPFVLELQTVALRQWHFSLRLLKDLLHQLQAKFSKAASPTV